jgi:DNA-binding MarR family transcriptional regulator
VSNHLADRAARIIAREPGITKRQLRDLLGVSHGVVEAVTDELVAQGRIRFEGNGERRYWPGGSA